MGSTQIFYYKNISLDSNGLCGLRFKLRNVCWGEFFEGNISSEITMDSCLWRNSTIIDPESGTIENGEDTPINMDKHAGSTIGLLTLTTKMVWTYCLVMFQEII